MADTDPIPINPLKRLRQEAELTVSQMTREGAGSEQFILNAEAGVYTAPPARILAVLADYHYGLDAEVLTAEYRAWQTLQRQASYGTLNPAWLENPRHGSTVSIHPFISWRAYSGVVSRVATSKLFCVHPATISKFELRPWECSTVPAALMEALNESGYSSESLAVFEYRWVNYRSYLDDPKGISPVQQPG